MNKSRIAAEIVSLTGTLDRVVTEPVRLCEPFITTASRFADLPGTVLLMSGGVLDSARYHILAVHPWMTITHDGRGTAIDAGGKSLYQEGDPFYLLKELIRAFSLPAGELPEPVAAGLFGYFAYDLKDWIEELPRTSIDDRTLPRLCLFAPSAVLVQNVRSGETRLCLPVRKHGGIEFVDAAREAFFKRFHSPLPAAGTFSGGGQGFSSAFTRESYMEGVEKIKEYIVSGHTYQVNLSQRFETGFSGDPFALFRTLFETAPAPFYAFLNAGDHQIVSTSPERFIKRRQSRVESRPIKGTRPRGKTDAEDRANAEALLGSRKDDAELSMIVDLMRNDLGRVCRGGSVKVSEHKRLEAYQNVFHLVSVVEGELREDQDSIDLIRAAFPGGSITGCPRIRAMEIIDELEPCRRHIYTGSIGYVGFHDTLDLSIAIRTATISGGKLSFSVGGGVVFDSDPADEYEETLHKGSSIMRIFKDRPEPAVPEKYAWFNGALLPAADARVPVADLGLQYGFGFFETIRVDRGAPAFLTEHLDRFHAAWKDLFGLREPDLTWEVIIGQVIGANRLEDRLASVKILASRGQSDTPGNTPILAVTVAPYVHRLEALGKEGLEVAIYLDPRQTPLAGHKTLNYLYYYRAGKWAKSLGADEALILNPDGSVSETNTANLLFIEGCRIVRPASPHVLPGIMEKQVIVYLEKSGYAVETRTVIPAQLPEFDAVLLTNSLMGAVPVIGIDNIPVKADISLCDRINAAVMGFPISEVSPIRP